MLEHWAELFPDISFCTLRGDPLPDDVMRERLLRAPRSWAQLLRELCVAACPDAKDNHLGILLVDLTNAIGRASDDVWNASWEAGILVVWAEMMRDGFICGFTRDQLVSPSPHSDRRWAHILRMLHLFLACIGQVALVGYPQADEQLLGILQDTVLATYSNLWDIKDSLRIGESPSGSLRVPLSGIATLRVGDTDDLYYALGQLGRQAAAMLQRQRSLKPLETRIPHIFLFIWIRAASPSVRAQALNHLSIIDDPEIDVWPPFLADALSGCIDGKDVLGAIKRDLEDEGTVDTALNDVFLLFLAWHTFRADARLDSSERQIMLCCLAAGRRQLCRGDEAMGEESTDAALETFAQGLQRRMETSQRHLFAFLNLLCHFIMLQFPKNEESPPAEVKEHIERILPHLASMSRDNRPKTVALRRHTLAAWQSVADEVRRRQLPRRHPAWRAFAQLWTSVKALLPAALEDEQSAQFGMLERCAWSECLCSRYKPAHKMRLCQGCERAAYCGERCQRNDWDKGGHRQRCCRVAR
ncbi:zinc finger MYND domain-containing protein [Phanerochaete sordida]|uniref:Zinc finger MYND domain-containing protein n=1 Tax=Phanerochaete sordida TaxID=48140 RepID=A0A9P3GCQ2_9APHY|nr:zinc finger MYND domain-containing protein [Phanerochaete sordida]